VLEARELLEKAQADTLCLEAEAGDWGSAGLL